MEPEQTFRPRNHQESPPRENPPRGKRSGAVPMLIGTAQKRRGSTETAEKMLTREDGQGNGVAKHPSHLTETDAERATRLASELMARDFPGKKKGVAIKS